MVIIKYREKNSSEWMRESFLNPQHYMKWRELRGRSVTDIKPVRKAVRRCFA